MNKQFKITKKYKIFSIAFIIMGCIVFTEGIIMLFFSSAIRLIPIIMILISFLNFFPASCIKNEINVNDDYVYIKSSLVIKPVKKRLEYSDIISVKSDKNSILFNTKTGRIIVLYIDQIEECVKLINDKITDGESGSKEN